MSGNEFKTNNDRSEDVNQVACVGSLALSVRIHSLLFRIHSRSVLLPVLHPFGGSVEDRKADEGSKYTDSYSLNGIRMPLLWRALEFRGFSWGGILWKRGSCADGDDGRQQRPVSEKNHDHRSSINGLTLVDDGSATCSPRKSGRC